MKRAGFPCTDSDITAQWLSAALEPRYPGTKAATVRTEPFGDDMGNSSRMYRLTLDYARNPHELPPRMVLKMAKAETISRVAFAAPRMLEMEARFFAELEPEITQDERLAERLGVPRGFAARYRHQGGNFFVLMEDLSDRNGGEGVRFRREREPLATWAEAEAGVRALAAFHARFWGSPRLAPRGDLSWIIHQRSPLLSTNVPFMRLGWPRFIKRIGDRIPADVRQRGALLVPISQRIHDALASGGSFGGFGGGGGAPDTVVHGDFHLENAYFSPAVDAETTDPWGIYDLQMMRIGKGAIDLACLVAGSVDIEALGGGEAERALVQTYVDAVREAVHTGAGGTWAPGYERDAAWHDYKLGVALHLVWNASAALALPFDTEAHHDYDEYIARICQSLDRNDGINYALGVLGDTTDAEGRSPTPPWGAPPNLPPVKRQRPGEAPGHDQGLTFHEPRFTDRPAGRLGAVRHGAKRAGLRWLVRRNAHHGQGLSVDAAALEEAHSLQWAEGTPSAEVAFDSYYLSAFSADYEAGPHLALRWGRRLRPSTGEIWCALWVPDEGMLWWGDGGDTARHPHVTCPVMEDGPRAVVARSGANTFRLAMDEPMQRWTADGRAKLWSPKRGEAVDAEIDLTWTALSAPFSFGSDLDPGLTADALAVEPLSKAFFDELKASHQEHFEQFGAVTGTIRVAGMDHPIQARGMRDRAWGARDWGYMQAYSANYFRAGDRHLNFTYASLPTMTNHRSGFVHIPNSRGLGSCFPVTQVSADFWDLLGPTSGVPPRDFTVAVRAGGVLYTIRVVISAGRTVGFDMGPGAMFVNLRFARCEVAWVDPVTSEPRSADGVGISEFGHRVAGYRPYRFEGATARPALQSMRG